MRFAASNNSGQWIRAGRTAANNAKNIFEQVTANSTDFGGMARAAQKARTSQQLANIKAETNVMNTGLGERSQNRAQEITSASDVYVKAKQAKTKMAGKLAAFAANIPKAFQSDPPPTPPTRVTSEEIQAEIDRLNPPSEDKPDKPDKPDTSTETTPPKPSTDAPTTGGTPVVASKVDFDTVYQLAQNSGATYPELVAAQWQLETGGTSGQGPTSNNNIFAQKGTDFYVDTREWSNGGLVAAPNQGWKAYESPQAATDWLVSNWYRDHPTHGAGVESSGGSLTGAAQQLVTQGYATDPEYGNKLLRILRERGYQV